MRSSSRILAAAVASLAFSACDRSAPAGDAASVPAAATTADAVPAAYAGPRVAGDTIEVYKSPTCGCCSMWMDHLREAGFTVVAHDTEDVASVKLRLKVPSTIQSCHTAVVHGIVVEGHVPIEVLAKLALERPAGVAGVGVEGMPLGAAGMEGYGRRDPYDVQVWNAAGVTRVLSHVSGS